MRKEKEGVDGSFCLMAQAEDWCLAGEVGDRDAGFRGTPGQYWSSSRDGRAIAADRDER